MTNAAIFPVVAAALIAGDGTILLQRRPDGKAHAGLWEFPGGKIEAGETCETALVRELAEEIGVQVDLAALESACFATAAMDGRQLVLLLYIVRSWHGEPRPIEAPELGWIEPAHLLAMPMPNADLALARQLLRMAGGVA